MGLWSDEDGLDISVTLTIHTISVLLTPLKAVDTSVLAQNNC